MAESNSPRLGIRRWSADTDTPSRTEIDGSFGQLELLTAIDKQDTFANRPAPAVRGTYFWDTTNSILWRDTGSAWLSVGSRAQDALFSASAASTVPLTALGATSQTGDLFQAKVGSTVHAKIDADGDVTGKSFNGQYTDLIGVTTSQILIAAKGAVGQTADLIHVRTSGESNRLRLTAAGNLETPYFRAAQTASVIGAESATNVANMSLFSGTGSFEVRSSTGGAGSTFRDFLYLKHDAADSTAVLRRLGLLIKVGAETGADAVKSGGMYLESSAAEFANPKLVLFRADAPVMEFPASGAASVAQALTVNGQLTVTPGSNPSVLMGDARIGVQSSHMYLRAGASSGFYFYSDGTHSGTPGDAGGGTTLAQLGSDGRFTAGKLTLTSITTSSLSQGSPTLMLGPASGVNMIMDDNEIMVRNNGSTSTLTVQREGGNTVFGGPLVLGSVSNNMVSTFQNAAFTNNSTSPTTSGATVCGTAFVAPPSGKVKLHFAADLQPGSGNWTAVRPRVRNGSTVNTGTDFVVADEEHWLTGYGAGGGIASGRMMPVTGLTPGNSYNVVLEHWSSSASGASVRRRRIDVEPVL